MLDFLQRYLSEAGRIYPKHYHKRMFASFHDPTGDVRVYIDIPNSYPRIVMLDTRDIAWAKVDEAALATVMKKLRKLPSE